MNIYGYCRISTAKQSIDRQIRNIKAEYPTAHIVQDLPHAKNIICRKSSVPPGWITVQKLL